MHAANQPALLLGPMLRYVGADAATIWVETDRDCEVSILGSSVRTFSVAGHYYALLVIEGLDAGKRYEYQVELDGARVWPEADSPYPASVIHTFDPNASTQILFGSCRVTRPHEHPYTLSHTEHDCGKGHDALRTYGERLLRGESEHVPDILVLLGDQVYADDVSPETEEFIRERRDPQQGAGLGIGDYEEYSKLYVEAWSDPLMRWLFSTVSISMIFDDHDVHDDWNTSDVWVSEMRQKDWWHERITSAFMSYWVYQHMGNLSPEVLGDDPFFALARRGDDVTDQLRKMSVSADRDSGASRWSFARDFGSSRLIILDTRAGRVLEEDKRAMIHEQEWKWVDEQMQGDRDHLLIGSSLPILLSEGAHYLEAWNEAVCGGAWGDTLMQRMGERIRQGVDLEHWAAFGNSFQLLVQLVFEVASGKRGAAPKSIIMLSGDVHHAYLAEAKFRQGVQSKVVQAVSSPFRNPLGKNEQAVLKLLASRPGAFAARLLARTAGVRTSSPQWSIRERPYFDNQIGTLDINGPHLSVTLETPYITDDGITSLKPFLTRRIT